ncbi:MAG: hypothetical protein ABJK28_03325 [Algibacter sp.]
MKKSKLKITPRIIPLFPVAMPFEFNKNNIDAEETSNLTIIEFVNGPTDVYFFPDQIT